MKNFLQKGEKRYNPEIHHRRSIRLAGYDYAQEGAYFITICTQKRECLFGKIVDGGIMLNDVGKMIDFQWNELYNRFNNIRLDEYIIMPNHFHGIITVGAPLVGAQKMKLGIQNIKPGVNNRAGTRSWAGTRPAPTGVIMNGQSVGAPLAGAQKTVGNIIGAFKSITTNEYIKGVKNDDWPYFCGKLWQRNYYEHIIRGENDLLRIREYIKNNLLNWNNDELFTV